MNAHTTIISAFEEVLPPRALGESFGRAPYFANSSAAFSAAGDVGPPVLLVRSEPAADPRGDAAAAALNAATVADAELGDRGGFPAAAPEADPVLDVRAAISFRRALMSEPLPERGVVDSDVVPPTPLPAPPA